VGAADGSVSERARHDLRVRAHSGLIVKGAWRMEGAGHNPAPSMISRLRTLGVVLLVFYSSYFKQACESGFFAFFRDASSFASGAVIGF